MNEFDINEAAYELYGRSYEDDEEKKHCQRLHALMQDAFDSHVFYSWYLEWPQNNNKSMRRLVRQNDKQKALDDAEQLLKEVKIRKAPYVKSMYGIDIG